MIRPDPIPVDPAIVADVKGYLRLEGDVEDALLARLAAAALAHGEAFTGRLFIARGVTEIVPATGDWTRLGATPVTAITGVSGLAPLATAVSLAPDAYALDIDASADGWVRANSVSPASRLVVAYQAGLAADWPSLPEPLRQGVVRLAAHLFTNRDAAEEGPPPAAIAALWRPWRRMRLS